MNKLFEAIDNLDSYVLERDESTKELYMIRAVFQSTPYRKRPPKDVYALTDLGSKTEIDKVMEEVVYRGHYEYDNYKRLPEICENCDFEFELIGGPADAMQAYVNSGLKLELPENITVYESNKDFYQLTGPESERVYMIIIMVTNQGVLGKIPDTFTPYILTGPGPKSDIEKIWDKLANYSYHDKDTLIRERYVKPNVPKEAGNAKGIHFEFIGSSVKGMEKFIKSEIGKPSEFNSSGTIGMTMDGIRVYSYFDLWDLVED